MAVRWRAPGRVNLIGEHTDYNEGFALPFAIEHACVAEVERAPRGHVYTVTSRQIDGRITVDLKAIDELPHVDLVPWVGYVLGPVWALRDRGYDVPPVRIHVDSDVPTGAGLSSSAAVICSVTCALDDLFGLGLTPDRLLAVARLVENEVVGAPTGGLDQLASLRCVDGHALFCDFSDLSTAHVPFDPEVHGLAVLVVDTRRSHRLVDGQYAARREGCARAVAALGLKSLREVDRLDDALSKLDDEEQRRYVRHVVTENARVVRAVELLQAGDLGAVGRLLSASHASLRDDFRVTIPELDVAAASLEASGAVGARMTGGGFGGCVIGLIDRGRVPDAVVQVEKAFARKGFRPPRTFTVRPSAGASRL